MKTILKSILLAGAALTLASGARAASIVYNFGLIADTAALTTGDLGLTATYTVSGLSITASAFGPALSGAADHLYGKNLGAGETGLGMTNDPTGQHEIYFGQGFVQLDLNALVGKISPNSVYAAFNSTTGGEQWTIYGSNTAGVLGGATLPASKTVIASGTNVQGVDTLLTGGFRYYDFVSTASAGGKNVLLKSLTVVPEPGTWALMITGFGGVGLMARRRRAMALQA